MEIFPDIWIVTFDKGRGVEAYSTAEAALARCRVVHGAHATFLGKPTQLTYKEQKE